MKIAFICGSMEPGLDGVGDYTRKLCLELINKGHRCIAIALNDKFQKTTPYLNDDIEELKIYRISSCIPEKERLKILKVIVDEHVPEWLSLQFVPFSFQRKGIISLSLINSLRILSRDIKFHVMIHEIWVGVERNASVKHQIWGFLQRLRILELLRSIDISFLTTTNRLYQIKMSKLGFQSTLLNLFSNIPFSKSDSLKENIENDLFILFGGIHPGAPVEQFAREVYNLAAQRGKRFKLVLAGRCGGEHLKWQSAWTKYNMPVVIAGEMEENKISELLQIAKVGIITTPIPLADKSGALAAMRLHQLPVVCVSRQWDTYETDDDIIPNDVFVYRIGCFEKVYDNLKTSVVNNSVEEIGDILIKKMVNYG